MARTAGRRTCETLASDPGQADQTGSAGGARKPGPGRQIVSQDNASASAESKVRPGPRPLTLRPHHRKTAETGPEALSTVSLPNIGAQMEICERSCYVPRMPILAPLSVTGFATRLVIRLGLEKVPLSKCACHGGEEIVGDRD